MPGICVIHDVLHVCNFLPEVVPSDFSKNRRE